LAVISSSQFIRLQLLHFRIVLKRVFFHPSTSKLSLNVIMVTMG
jgi:hypothetical protein